MLVAESTTGKTGHYINITANLDLPTSQIKKNQGEFE